MPESIAEYGLLIGGSWRPAAAGGAFTTMNPSDTREAVARCAEGAAEDVDRAVAAAADALPGWRGLAGPARGAVLLRIADAIERAEAELGRLAAREMGKPIGEARAEAGRAAAIFRFYAGEAWRPLGEVIPSTDAASLLYTERAPVGVAAVITPWNFPLAIPAWKIAPALAYGNTVVWKPASLAAGTAAALAGCIEAAGLPGGPLNLGSGGGTAVGDPLARHPGVAAVSFTGSGPVGRGVAAAAAARGAKFQLELGGKNPAVVAADADLDQAADLITSGAMRSAGQKCTATSRAIVVREVYDGLRERLLQRVAGLRVGPALDPATYVGPVAAASQYHSILEALAQARGEGARALAGGGALTDGPLAHGYFIAPTLLEDVDPAGPTAQQEIFGPVLALMAVADLDEALQVANGVAYGLSASLFTRDLNAALTWSRRVEAGMVRVNAETAGVELQAPFGGLKASSSHSREQGRAALDFYTDTRTVTVAPARPRG